VGAEGRQLERWKDGVKNVVKSAGGVCGRRERRGGVLVLGGVEKCWKGYEGNNRREGEE